jgi:hypothetical protein
MVNVHRRTQLLAIRAGAVFQHLLSLSVGEAGRRASLGYQWQRRFRFGDAATASEKAELTQEFIKKKNLYLRKMYNAGREARAKDRTYRRIVRLFS